MEVGGEYLVFIENQVDGLGEKIPVYQVYVENAFTPIFSYQEHENNICETGGESTYVKYNQVCENEFFCYNPERNGCVSWPKKRNDRKI